MKTILITLFAFLCIFTTKNYADEKKETDILELFIMDELKRLEGLSDTNAMVEQINRIRNEKDRTKQLELALEKIFSRYVSFHGMRDYMTEEYPVRIVTVIPTKEENTRKVFNLLIDMRRDNKLIKLEVDRKTAKIVIHLSHNSDLMKNLQSIDPACRLETDAYLRSPP